MDHEQILYHGSQLIVDRPESPYQDMKRDFGPGFYMTASEELAKEWACSEEVSGYANKYVLDTFRLRSLDLTSRKFHILNWLAVVLANRKPALTSDLVIQGYEYVLDRFYLTAADRCDIIAGWRADNAYYSFAVRFLNNDITLDELRRAMKLGKEGKQIVIKTDRALERLRFVSSAPADRSIYYPRIIARDVKARETLQQYMGTEDDESARYLVDIMRGEWQNDDPRLR